MKAASSHLTGDPSHSHHEHSTRKTRHTKGFSPPALSGTFWCGNSSTLPSSIRGPGDGLTAYPETGRNGDIKLGIPETPTRAGEVSGSPGRGRKSDPGAFSRDAGIRAGEVMSESFLEKEETSTRSGPVLRGLSLGSGTRRAEPKTLGRCAEDSRDRDTLPLQYVCGFCYLSVFCYRYLYI
jgi:hypothetical protein